MGTARLSQHIEEGQSTDEKKIKKIKGQLSLHICALVTIFKNEKKKKKEQATCTVTATMMSNKLVN